MLLKVLEGLVLKMHRKRRLCTSGATPWFGGTTPENDLTELLNRSWGTPLVEPNARRFRSISAALSFSTVSVLSCYTFRVRALHV